MDPGDPKTYGSGSATLVFRFRTCIDLEIRIKKIIFGGFFSGMKLWNWIYDCELSVKRALGWLTKRKRTFVTRRTRIVWKICTSTWRQWILKSKKKYGGENSRKLG
jgi:hypothetical protein